MGLGQDRCDQPSPTARANNGAVGHPSGGGEFANSRVWRGYRRSVGRENHARSPAQWNFTAKVAIRGSARRAKSA